MNILFVTYPMAFHTPGGGEIQLLSYKRQLELLGHKVDLFNQWAPHFHNYDIVHFFSCILGSVHFCSFVKKLNKPLVVSSSLWLDSNNKNNYGLDEIRAQLMLADRVITNSELENSALSSILNINSEKFSCVYNGVDELFCRDVSKDLFITKFDIKNKFVLCVGNIEERKNQLRLALAMKKFPELDLVLIGHIRDPDYAHKLFEIDVNRIKYIGFLDQTELLVSAYKSAELFALPSTLETPGLAALEAVYSGCKTIVTEVGSTKEYFQNEVVYVDPFSVENIGLGIKKGLEQKASKFCENTYLWKNVIQNLEQTYLDLLK